MAMSFESTRWSLIVSAGSGSPQADQALAELCRIYWPPVFAYIARRGYRRTETEDLAQEFFARLIEKHYLKQVCRDRGKFRAFLLTAVKHFLLNEWDRRNAKKRQGDLYTLPLDELSERSWGLFTSYPATPEHCFERQWALTVLERALERLENEQPTPVAKFRFKFLREYLTSDGTMVPYSTLAKDLEMTEGALKVAVHRLRGHYGDAIRVEVAETVPESTDINGEIRYLIEVLGRS